MNTGKSREENFDPDFERRILISRLALSVLLTLTSIWTAVFLISNDLVSAAIFGSLSLLYALSLLLFRLGYLLFARAFWLFTASTAIFACIVFGQPFTDLDYLFLPIMTLPLLAFSWKYERKFCYSLPHCRLSYGQQVFISHWLEAQFFILVSYRFHSVSSLIRSMRGCALQQWPF